ncbi:uncharacterized protein V6R79_010554 [Siganus canaliculatus]
MVQSSDYTEPPTTGKHTPAAKREDTAETQIAEERDHKFSVRTIEDSLRSRSYMATITPPFVEPLLNTRHRAVGTHDTPPTIAEVYPSFGEIRMTPTTSAFEVKPRLDEKTPATYSDYTVILPGTSHSHRDHAAVDETTPKNVSSVTSTTRTRAALVETDNVERRETLEQPRLVEKTAQRQSHGENSDAQEAITAEVTLPEPEATAAQTTVRATERTLLTGKTTAVESGPRPFLPEYKPVSEMPWRNHRSRISPHPYLTGVTEVSDDLCGSGNYTAEMSLNLGGGVEPGDAVAATGNLRVIINLRTNNTRLSLAVTSCCLSPTIHLNLTNSTCFVFSRLAAEHAGIKQLPSILSTSASFTISLFQMINYSVVYLHCDLSVCLQNHSDCERHTHGSLMFITSPCPVSKRSLRPSAVTLCLQQRSLFPFEDPGPKFKNRISFGPMMKEVNNSTFPEEIDPSELDLVLVIVSLVVASSFLTVTLLLVWFAYRRWPIWRFPSGAAPRACCGCLHPGGDSILP